MPHEAGAWPVLVFMHGGIGTKDNMIDISQELAEQGLVVFTINWPPSGLSAAYQENGRKIRETYEVLSCAVSFASSTAAEYGGDPSQVIVVGFSWGADYGSWFALSGENLESEWDQFSVSRGGPPPQIDCEKKGFSGAADAFIGIGGTYTYAKNLREKDEEIWNLFSPMAQIGKNPNLSVRFLHGEKDDFGPVQPARFNDLLVEAGYDSKLILFDGGHEVPIDHIVELISELFGD